MVDCDINKIKKARYSFIMVQGKHDQTYAKISRKEALFILQHNEGEFSVNIQQKKDWSEAFIYPAT